MQTDQKNPPERARLETYNETFVFGWVLGAAYFIPDLHVTSSLFLADLECWFSLPFSTWTVGQGQL